jgi:phage baseplate assembly protein W
MAQPSLAQTAAGGWAFPPAFDHINKTVCISTGCTNISENLRILFATDVGERFLLPSYGTPLSKYIFGPLNTTTENELKRDLKDAISRWEPRIELLTVELMRMASAPQTVEIQIMYRERSTGTQASFSVPFSLEGAGHVDDHGQA